MRKERKYGYRARKIAQLEEELKQAKEDISVLRNENKALQARLGSATKALEQKEEAHLAYAKQYQQEVAEAIDARETYEAMSRECVEIKAEYTKQMKKLLDDVRKTTRHQNK